jgi:hypothetical protein
VRTSIRAAHTVPLLAVVGAPLSFASLNSRARRNQPVSATHGGAVGDERWE